ncbi:MAG TPA: ArsR family transcriptional regulator [Methanocorpusculum sp.]|nr:ArsR family transcriptional regulator [Methanocorpusculum sp.]
MLDQDNISHLLDILGNRNRRRILDLLRQKPCFVTEISDRLVINPKAVIEHLAIMQKEAVITSYQDDKRRKYYYLVNDFTLSVRVKKAEQPPQTDPANTESVLPLSDKIMMIRRLLDSRDKLIDHLEAVEKDIDEMMEDVIVNGRTVFQNNIEAELLLALVYAPLTPIELSDTSGRSIPEVTAALRSLLSKGYLHSQGGRYTLCSIPRPALETTEITS